MYAHEIACACVCARLYVSAGVCVSVYVYAHAYAYGITESGALGLVVRIFSILLVVLRFTFFCTTAAPEWLDRLPIRPNLPKEAFRILRKTPREAPKGFPKGPQTGEQTQ